MAEPQEEKLVSDQDPPAVAETASAKKGLSPLAWVGIGCLSIVVIGFLAFLALGFFLFQAGRELVEDATGSGSIAGFLEEMKENPAKTVAETMIRMNPELDAIATDDEAGTITFRNNRTGEEATLNFEDIAEGRFSMTTSDGEVSVAASADGAGGVTFSGPEGEVRFGASADLSDVPDWVPAYPGATEVQGMMHSTSAEGIVGAFTSKTSDGAQTVVDHFKALFEGQGYEIASESMTRTGDGAFGVVVGELAAEGRSINVVVIESAGETQVTINYNQKRQ